MATKTTATATSDVVKRARNLMAVELDLDGVLTRMGARENTAVARRLAACEQTHPARAQAWRRLAALMMHLAPSRPKTLQRAILFYIPDGKYQMQVFALDDAADGTISVCCENVLAEAIKAHVVAPQPGAPGRYTVHGKPLAVLIDQLDGKTENPPPYANAMTGWNRKALRIILPADAAESQVQAAELICAISALRWAEAQS